MTIVNELYSIEVKFNFIKQQHTVKGFPNLDSRPKLESESATPISEMARFASFIPVIDPTHAMQSNKYEITKRMIVSFHIGYFLLNKSLKIDFHRKQICKACVFRFVFSVAIGVASIVRFHYDRYNQV